MRAFQSEGRTINAYLVEPEHRSGAGVLVLHAWWGLTQPFRRICDQRAEAGFAALAPDLYHGKTTTAIEEAKALVDALNQEKERVRNDIAGAVQVLRQHVATPPAGGQGQGKLAVVGFSLGGAYALDLSVKEVEEIAAVVAFYCAYSGLEYSRARAAYLCHFAENDPFDPPEAFAEMEREIQTAGKPITSYTYPGTTHWFFEENRPEYDAQAAHVA